MDDDFCSTLLATYGLTPEELTSGIPRAMRSLSPTEAALLAGVPVENPRALTDEHAEALRLVLVRAAALVFGEKVDAERVN